MAIDLSQCKSILESGDWVSLSFITADVKRGNGGTVIELKRCRIARNRRPTSPTPIQGTGANAHSGDGGSKNPNHNYHFTRNLELPNKQIVKVHPLLIFQINNHQVI